MNTSMNDGEDFKMSDEDIRQFAITAASTFGNAFGDMATELDRAIKKHGVMQTPCNPAMPDGERLKILVEEVGEVARAMTYDEGDPDQLDKELIQVATMALACVVGMRLRRDHD